MVMEMGLEIDTDSDSLCGMFSYQQSVTKKFQILGAARIVDETLEFECEPAQSGDSTH